MLNTASVADRNALRRAEPSDASASPTLATVRAVAPMRFADVVPADLAGQDAPSWEVVDPIELLVDEAYQRDLLPKSLALIRRIIAGWSWAKFKPPVCARVDGALHVLDGQHTALTAASHGDVGVIPVLVVPAPEVADRAAAFLSHAVNRLQTKPVQVHHAAVEAGYSDAVTIEQVLDRAGVKLLPYNPPTNTFRSGETIGAPLHGVKHRIVAPLTCPDGTLPIVLAIWVIEPDQAGARFITARPFRHKAGDPPPAA